jgi:hypothetical protein
MSSRVVACRAGRRIAMAKLEAWMEAKGVKL